MSKRSQPLRAAGIVTDRVQAAGRTGKGGVSSSHLAFLLHSASLDVCAGILVLGVQPSYMVF
jgi:hypothetical protein